MFYLLFYLFTLLPSGGVVSGGRQQFFDRMVGLVPDSSWLYAQPFLNYDSSTFTRLNYIDGYSKSFSVTSSGETAEIHPYLSSTIYSNGYSAAFFLKKCSVFAIKDSEFFNYSLNFSKMTIDFRNRNTNVFSLTDIALQYKSENFLVVGSSEIAILAFKYPICEFFSFGPSLGLNQGTVKPWLFATAEVQPLSIVAFSSMNNEELYQRVFGFFDYRAFCITYGWNGENYCNSISFEKENFLTDLTLLPFGILCKFQPKNSLLFLASYKENNFYQAEIQTEFFKILSGFSILHSPQEGLQVGINLGINLSTNIIQNSFVKQLPWWSEPTTVR